MKQANCLTLYIKTRRSRIKGLAQSYLVTESELETQLLNATSSISLLCFSSSLRDASKS